MPWIENISCANIIDGKHHDAGSRGVLIQIMDPATFFPEPKHHFAEIHRFEFLDVDGDCMSNNGSGDMEDMSEWAITEDQAKQIVAILKKALKENRSVICHCFAGLCRSGAVAEVGITMGFDDVGNFRSPNERVLKFMFEELGIPYEEKVHNVREDWRRHISAKYD